MTKLTTFICAFMLCSCAMFGNDTTVAATCQYPEIPAKLIQHMQPPLSIESFMVLQKAQESVNDGKENS